MNRIRLAIENLAIMITSFWMGHLFVMLFCTNKLGDYFYAVAHVIAAVTIVFATICIKSMLATIRHKQMVIDCLATKISQKSPLSDEDKLTTITNIIKYGSGDQLIQLAGAMKNNKGRLVDIDLTSIDPIV